MRNGKVFNIKGETKLYYKRAERKDIMLEKRGAFIISALNAPSYIT